jgi:hypothetical protein
MNQDELSSALGVSNDTESAKDSSIVVSRYKDAYALAESAVGFGSLIKVFGWIVAVIMFFAVLITAGASAGEYSSDEQASGGLVLIKLVAVVIQLLVFYIFGTLVGAVGHILRATLDSAVTSAQLLEEKKPQNN